MEDNLHLIVIGGGAAGIFAAIAAAEADNQKKVVLLEKTNVFLAKVRVSGGGRCNVTHDCYEPRQLVTNYPRGNKALIGPFTRFQPRDTWEWFEKRGVTLKTEKDGRVFPTTNSSQTIIECLLQAARDAGVDLRLRQEVTHIRKEDSGLFCVQLSSGEVLKSRALLIATGSNRTGHQWAEAFGHTIEPAVPSLFTFNCPSSSLKDLSGIAVDAVELKIENMPYVQRGPLLLTHWGFSGPAALKLSAWAARDLNQKNYQINLLINWVPSYTAAMLREELLKCKKATPSALLATFCKFPLPSNLWKRLVELSSIDLRKKLADLSNAELTRLIATLHASSYRVEGKTTNKEEFVTAGGIRLDEIHFKTMESRITPGLFFAGEVIDVDGITGGFNFQNAWTTGWIAGLAAMQLK